MTSAGHHTEHHLPFWRKYIFATDHKTIGIQFLFTGLIFFAVGGALAMLLRYQLAWPGEAVPFIGNWLSEDGSVAPEHYATLFTMHGSVMIFLVIIPLLVGAFGNFLIPLQIGAPDMAFPRVNMLSFWLVIPAATVMVVGMFIDGGGAAGWTGYPPLSVLKGAQPQEIGQICWIVGVIIIGASSILGSVNYITTIINMRAPGMSFFRMPLTVWSLFITSILVVMGTPVLASAAFMLLLDKTAGTTFFIATDTLLYGNEPTSYKGGGQPLLWQHLFWFYSHPAVYIMILPAMGITSEVLSTFARKPVFGYRPMVYAMGSIAGLGFIVWAHHMFQSGLNPSLGMAFTVSTMLIAVPTAVKVFNWMGTIWGGNIRFTTPMLNALAFVTMFLIGGLSGIFMASTPVDMYIHDTYFIVGHIHYVLFGGSVFGIFAGIYFWYPKMFGRKLNEGLGKTHFWLTFVFMNMTFFLMHIVGLGGQPRRYATILHGEFTLFNHLQPLNVLMTIAALALGISQLPFVINFFLSLKKDLRAAVLKPLCLLLTVVPLLAFLWLLKVSAVLFTMNSSAAIEGELTAETVPAALRSELAANGLALSQDASAFVERTGKTWMISGDDNTYYATKQGGRLAVYARPDLFSAIGPEPGPLWRILGTLVVLAACIPILRDKKFVFGEEAGRNPWEATTLEWTVPSPPGHGNFETTPVVLRGPHEYSSPEVEEDWLSQTRNLETEEN